MRTVKVTDELVDRINKFLDENEFNEYVYKNFPEGTISMEITWGDWKHDHWWAMDLMDQFFRENNLYGIHREMTTEEDGSDTYSAIHSWEIYEEGDER